MQAGICNSRCATWDLGGRGEKNVRHYWLAVYTCRQIFNRNAQLKGEGNLIWLLLLLPASLTPERLERGGPLLTVETEVNGVSKSTNEKGPSLVGLLDSSCVPVQQIFALPWLLQSAQYKILFSSPHTFSLYQTPSPRNLGRQACWVACLCVSSGHSWQIYHRCQQGQCKSRESDYQCNLVVSTGPPRIFDENINGVKGTQERECFGSHFEFCTFSLLVMLKQ